MNDSIRVYINYWEERYPDFRLALPEELGSFIDKNDYFEVSKKFYERYLKVKKDYDTLQKALEVLCLYEAKKEG